MTVPFRLFGTRCMRAESLAKGPGEVAIVMDRPLHLQGPEANRAIGAIVSHDISLPLSEIARFIDDAGAMLARMGDMRINCFGHLGDGNLHYNLFPAAGRTRDDYDALRGPVQEAVHEMVVARGGSFSAEHGVGRMKVADLARWGDPETAE